MSTSNGTDRLCCSVEGCEQSRKTKGLCGAHYMRRQRWGDPLGAAPPGPTTEEKFWAKTEQTDGCWEWRGSRFPNGYGYLMGFPGPRPRVGVCHLAHRYAYELLVSPIPKGLDLDHLCRNRACVNPAHLEPVTRQENLLRGETTPAKAKAGAARRDNSGRFA